MPTDYEEWYRHQQKIISEEYTEIIKRVREKAQRQVNNTVKESLVKVDKRKNERRGTLT